MSIKGIGNDIIEIHRIQASIDRYGEKFLNRIFSSPEQEYCFRHREFARHFAGRFAAKEATVKALGIGFGEEISWLDIEILHDHRGKPIVSVLNHVNELFSHPQLMVSISHCKEYATAVALWLG